MGEWDTFAVVTGGAAAALLGLLFVAVSIRVDVIAASTELRNRAAQTLGLFVTVLLIALVLAIPGQSLRVVGAELIALAVVAATVLRILDRRARSGPTQSLGRLLDRIAPDAITSVLLLAAGIVLTAGQHAGLYVLVAPVLAALVGGVISAWLLLVRTTK
jgi:hypothetical protein